MKMNMIDIQSKAAEYKFQLTATAMKKEEWATIVASSLVETLNRIIVAADLQNFAHVIQADGANGRIVYLNLLYTEKATEDIKNTSDKENLQSGRQLAFKPEQNGDIGVYSCEHTNHEYVADFIASNEPGAFLDEELVSEYFEDFLEAIIE